MSPALASLPRLPRTEPVGDGAEQSTDRAIEAGSDSRFHRLESVVIGGRTFTKCVGCGLYVEEFETTCPGEDAAVEYRAALVKANRISERVRDEIRDAMGWVRVAPLGHRER